MLIIFFLCTEITKNSATKLCFRFEEIIWVDYAKMSKPFAAKKIFSLSMS